MPYKRKEQIGDCKIIGFPVTASIYGIRDEAGGIVYIGSTINPIKHRIRAHIATAKRDDSLPVHKWMISRLFCFDVIFLESVEESMREDAERRWIKDIKPILNLTDGGKGMSGYKFAGTPHARKISKKLRTGSFFECVKCKKSFWRKLKDIKRSHNKYCSRNCSNRRNYEAA